MSGDGGAAPAALFAEPPSAGAVAAPAAGASDVGGGVAGCNS